MEEVARTTLKIYTTLDDRQVDHYLAIIKVRGNIFKDYLFFLIYLGYNYIVMLPLRLLKLSLLRNVSIEIRG